MLKRNGIPSLVLASIVEGTFRRACEHLEFCLLCRRDRVLHLRIVLHQPPDERRHFPPPFRANYESPYHQNGVDDEQDDVRYRHPFTRTSSLGLEWRDDVRPCLDGLIVRARLWTLVICVRLSRDTGQSRVHIVAVIFDFVVRFVGFGE